MGRAAILTLVLLLPLGCIRPDPEDQPILSGPGATVQYAVAFLEVANCRPRSQLTVEVGAVFTYQGYVDEWGRKVLITKARNIAAENDANRIFAFTGANIDPTTSKARQTFLAYRC